jgi:hypothetical protein
MATPNKTNGKDRAPKKVYTDAERKANFSAAASKRTMRAIKSLRALHGITRPGRYAWSPEQVAKILGTLATELKSVEARFQNPTSRTVETFTV